MAHNGTAGSRPRHRLISTLTSLYYVMMAMLGATIGAIAGLSNTSVSNTLLELIASVVVGSAGLYFINRKALRQEADALWRIGLLGVLFMAAFWGAYVAASDYRYDGPAHYEWQASAPLHYNVALAEIHGHAQKLGIADEDLEAALAADTSLSDDTKACDLLREDPKKLSNWVKAAYKGFVQNPSTNSELKGLATYVRARFDAINDPVVRNEPGAAIASARKRDQAVAMLLLLVREHSDLAKPAQPTCGNGDSGDCRAATLVQEMLVTCPDVGLVDALTTMRAHAAAFHTIWGDEVSTQPPKAPYTFETSGSDQR